MTMTLSTLLVHLVLKTYVPDELSGLVDALADPRAYLSAHEKRKEALHHMGVDDSDIVEVVPIYNNGIIGPTSGTNLSGRIGSGKLQPKKNDNKNKVNGCLNQELVFFLNIYIF